MTEEFRLREPVLTLHICGLNFGVQLCGETAGICGEILEEAKKKLALIRRKDTDCLVSEVEICQFLEESIDKLLGLGSVDKIFGNRRRELLDLSDLMCYIVSKIRDGFLKHGEDSE